MSLLSLLFATTIDLQNLCFFAIKGDFTNNLESIFTAYEYKDLKVLKEVDWKTKETILYNETFPLQQKGILIKFAWYQDGWTIIEDPEMVLIAFEEKLERISQKYNTSIYNFLIQKSSGTFAFSYVDIKTKRFFLSVEGEVSNNSGKPLEIEKGINVNKSIYSNDIVKLMKNIGIDYKKSETINKIKVIELR